MRRPHIREIPRRTSPRQMELDEARENLRRWSYLQEIAPDQTRWDIADMVILRTLRKIQELTYVQEWELVEEVDLTRHQFRGQGL